MASSVSATVPSVPSWGSDVRSLGDGPSFFAELDRGRWLVGADQVCAGTAPIIRQVFDALVGRTAPSVLSEEARRIRDVAPVAVGLHVAHLLARQAAARRGEGEPVTEELPPWLRAVFALPGRPPEHVRRLFPSGATPPIVEKYVAEPGQEAFERGLDALDASTG